MRPTVRRRPGFTLIELLIVVSLLILLATAGSIQLLRARIIAHEEIALTSVRLISRACHFFFLVNQRFPTLLTELGNAIPPYIPANLVGTGTFVTKQGYEFTYAQAGNTFTLKADPVAQGVTGTRHFFVDEQLTIRMDMTGPADSSDPPIP